MRCNFLLALSLAASVSAKTIDISVGSGGLKFDPDSVTAAEGDILAFSFNGKHSVVAGSYDDPCKAVSSGGFYSGMHSSGTFEVTVNSTDPIFFYCSKSSHCKKGMVGVVNPTDDMTLDTYKSGAKSAGNGESPDSTFGGTMDSGVGHLTSSIGAVAAALGVAVMLA